MNVRKNQFRIEVITVIYIDIFNTVVEKAKNIDVSENDISVIIYIAGYIGRKIEFKVGCSLCLNLILTNRNLDISKFLFVNIKFKHKLHFREIFSI
jgi:hypothetical protein